MREILFIGKRTDNGEWVEGFYWESMIKVTKYIIIGNIADMQLYPVIPETVGQFTGLTDKNGKKIFEGDICVSTLGYIFKVAYDSENARFIGFDIENNSIIYPGREPKAEVIGSIHDNPELLKGGQQ